MAFHTVWFLFAPLACRSSIRIIASTDPEMDLFPGATSGWDPMLRFDPSSPRHPSRGHCQLGPLWSMNSTRSRYRGHAVWLYYRLGISLRDVEDLLAERGITVSYETIHRWCAKFGLDYAKRLRRRQGRLGDTWFLDEVFVTINSLVQSRRNRRAAERFFRKLSKGQGKVPFRPVTDKLKSYGMALWTIMPSVNHDTKRYANNRAEVSHQPTRRRERQMRRFKPPRQSQLFLSVQGVVLNLFRVGRHRLKSKHHRMLRERSFVTWNVVTAG